MAGWINMPLGTKVGLGPGHIMLHGVPASPSSLPEKGTQPLIFGSCLLWPNSHPSQLLLSTCMSVWLWPSKRPISHIAVDTDNDMLCIQYLTTGYGRHWCEIR